MARCQSGCACAGLRLAETVVGVAEIVERALLQRAVGGCSRILEQRRRLREVVALVRRHAVVVQLRPSFRLRQRHV